MKDAGSGRTDWEALRRKTDEEVHAAALADPDNPPLRPDELARMKRVSLARHVRLLLGMTQEQFAKEFHLALPTLRDWEQHRSEPDQAARTLLRLIEKSPDEVRRLLA